MSTIMIHRDMLSYAFFRLLRRPLHPLGFKSDIARIKKLSTLNSGVYDLQYQHLMTRGYYFHRRNENMESLSPGGPAIYVIFEFTGPSTA